MTLLSPTWMLTFSGGDETLLASYLFLGASSKLHPFVYIVIMYTYSFCYIVDSSSVAITLYNVQLSVSHIGNW
jgi:outer membrane protein W